MKPLRIAMILCILIPAVYIFLILASPLFTASIFIGMGDDTVIYREKLKVRTGQVMVEFLEGGYV